jgi:membrane-bound serine protease (ClpP class)
MALIIGTAIAVIFFDGILRVVIIAAVALIEIAEIGVWLKWRKVRATTGAEGIIGMKGITLSECRPEGQVQVKGQIWKALCPEGAGEGDEIVVESVDGLRLTVARR